MNENERCGNCKHLRNLWYWENYPHDKKHGYCCNLFNNKKDDFTVMQLYGDLFAYSSFCECFEPKQSGERMTLEDVIKTLIKLKECADCELDCDFCKDQFSIDYESEALQVAIDIMQNELKSKNI